MLRGDEDDIEKQRDYVPEPNIESSAKQADLQQYKSPPPGISRAPQSPPADTAPEADIEQVCHFCEVPGSNGSGGLIVPCVHCPTLLAHRSCLNAHRADVDNPQRIVSCQECDHDYRLLPSRSRLGVRRLRFHAYVAKDFSLVFIAWQLAVAVLAAVMWGIDTASSTCLASCQPPALDLEDIGSCLACPPIKSTFFPTRMAQGYAVATYYVCGLVIFFALLGIAATCKWCCCWSDADADWDDGFAVPDRQLNGCCCGSCCCCCCGCSCCSGNAAVGSCQRCIRQGPPLDMLRTGRSWAWQAVSTRQGQTMGRTAVSKGASSTTADERQAAMLAVLVLIIIAFAVLGVFVGLVLTTAMLQRITQRHLHRLDLKQIAADYEVADAVNNNKDGDDDDDIPYAEVVDEVRKLL